MLAISQALKDAIADPAKSIEALKKRNPLLDETVELGRRLQSVIDNAIATDRVRQTGLSDVDPDKLKRTIEMVAKTFNIPAADPATIYRADFLPAREHAYAQMIAADPPPRPIKFASEAPCPNIRSSAIELIHVVLPPRREHKWTGATEPIGGYLLVKLTAQDGSVGWGECAGPQGLGRRIRPLFRRKVATARAVIEPYLAPAIKGAMPSNLADIHARMDQKIKGYPYAKAAMDMAAYDLAGHSA